jgi:glycosyltransferase involved in cell wall biosynthesis
MKEDTASVILTVYNQDFIIKRVFLGITSNISECVKEIIVIIDGCTDKSEEIIMSLLDKSPVPVNVIHTPDLNEVLANNVGLKAAKYNYSIIIQDDCVVTEYYFDKRLFKPFHIVPNVLAVSGRDSHNAYITPEGRLNWNNLAGVDGHTPRNLFAIRDCINRGPLMIDNEKMKQLNYFDEAYAPINCDDIELSIRAYKEYGWVVGSYPVGYISEVAWGKTRNDSNSYNRWQWSEDKNMRETVRRHRDYLEGPHHDQDIIIE